MKICFVINEFSFFKTHRLDLCISLSQLHEITIVTDAVNASGEDLNMLSPYQIKIIHLNQRSGSLNFYSYFLYITKLGKILKKENPKRIFFVTLETSLVGLLLKLFYQNFNMLLLVTGLGPFQKKVKGKKKIFWNLVKALSKLNSKKEGVHFVFQNLEDQKKFLDSNIVTKSSSSIIFGNGINRKKFFSKRKFNIDENNLKFLMVGNLLKSKGIEEYLHASRKIKIKYPTVEFNLAGKYLPSNFDSISKEKFDEICNSRVVNYLGSIEHDEIQDIYNQSTIFVLPSYGEGLPKSALEAASMGMPLIMSNVAGCRECIINNRNGLLVKPENPDALFLAMESFIKNRNLINSMGKRSIALVEEKFSLAVISKQYLDLIG
jgi:glycosyltransferase involved in cell wall biosynthesis